MLFIVAAFSVDISSQLKAARQQAEVSRQELTEYKEKAARILQVQPSLMYSTLNLINCSNVISRVEKNSLKAQLGWFYWVFVSFLVKPGLCKKGPT